MNVRISPRGCPSRTLLYGGVRRLQASAHAVTLIFLDASLVVLSRCGCGAIDVDNLPGDWWS